MKKDKMVTLTCENCGNTFERSEAKIRANKKNKSSAICCSRRCSGQYGRKMGNTPDIFVSRAFNNYLNNS